MIGSARPAGRALPEHLHALKRAGAAARPVRRLAEIEACDGLVIPGGESTTLSRLAAVFIRALWVGQAGPGAAVLGEDGGRIIAVRQGVLLATAFHPELTRTGAFTSFRFDGEGNVMSGRSRSATAHQQNTALARWL